MLQRNFCLVDFLLKYAKHATDIVKQSRNKRKYIIYVLEGDQFRRRQLNFTSQKIYSLCLIKRINLTLLLYYFIVLIITLAYYFRYTILQYNSILRLYYYCTKILYNKLHVNKLHVPMPKKVIVFLKFQVFIFQYICLIKEAYSLYKYN